MKDSQPALKFGIIGCRHGHVYSQIKELLDIPNAVCAGVYEEDDASVQGVLDRFPVSRVDSAEKLLDDPDVVLIGTAEINNRKADVILRALAAGKHVIADKPLCTRIEDLNAIEQLATERGLRVGLQLTERFGGASRRMKTLVDSGAVGHIANVMCWRPHRLGRETRPDWMFDDEQYGGIIVDLAIHDVDIIRWLCGGVFTEITAYEQNFGNPADTDFHDIGTLLGRVSTGATGMVRTDWFTAKPSPVHGDTRFLVTGTEGMIEVRTAGDLWATTPDGKSEQILTMTNGDGVKSETREPPAKSLIRDFVDSIREGIIPVISNTDVFEATRATLMARMSSKRGRTVYRRETLG